MNIFKRSVTQAKPETKKDLSPPLPLPLSPSPSPPPPPPPPPAHAAASTENKEKVKKLKAGLEEERKKVRVLETRLKDRKGELEEAKRTIDDQRDNLDELRGIKQERDALKRQLKEAEGENEKLREDMDANVHAKVSQLERELATATWKAEAVAVQRLAVVRSHLALTGQYVALCLKVLNEEVIQRCDCEMMENMRKGTVEMFSSQLGETAGPAEAVQKRMVLSMCQDLKSKMDELKAGTVFSIAAVSGPGPGQQG